MLCSLKMPVTIKITRTVDGNKVEVPPYKDGAKRDVVGSKATSK